MYWFVDVKLSYESESGKIQNVTEKYLVEAVSATDAEVKVTKELEGENEFSVNKVVKSKILKVL
jgi:hypothetical protein